MININILRRMNVGSKTSKIISFTSGSNTVLMTASESPIQREETSEDIIDASDMNGQFSGNSTVTKCA